MGVVREGVSWTPSGVDMATVHRLMVAVDRAYEARSADAEALDEELERILEQLEGAVEEYEAESGDDVLHPFAAAFGESGIEDYEVGDEENPGAMYWDDTFVAVADPDLDFIALF